MVKKKMFRVRMDGHFYGYREIEAKNEEEALALAEELSPSEFLTDGDWDVDDTEFDAQEVEK